MELYLIIAYLQWGSRYEQYYSRILGERVRAIGRISFIWVLLDFESIDGIVAE